jgi:hypothetical protein
LGKHLDSLLTVNRYVDIDREGFVGEDLTNEENVSGVVFNEEHFDRFRMHDMPPLRG